MRYSDNPTRQLVLTSLYAGLGVACGYLFLLIPNVETVTLIAFLAGNHLGKYYGLIASLTTCLLYFGINPQGGFFPPLLIAQILGMAAAPVLGSLYRNYSDELIRKQFLNLIVLGLIALSVTLWYDLLTNLSFPIATRMNLSGVISTLILGIPFAAVHVLSNVLIFVIVAPPLIRVIRKFEGVS